MPIEAKYIRIYPVEYEGWMCLRAELYGKGTYCTKAANIGNIYYLLTESEVITGKSETARP